MIKASVNLQDLRRKIYIKAKADKSWKFWGLYTHVCKMETLEEAYKLVKSNKGAAGIDGVTFEDIEQRGRAEFLLQIQEELKYGKYRPVGTRKCDIPKPNGKGFRTLNIPTIKDRTVQAALKLILEPIFEADFKDGSFGYRPKRSPKQAIERVSKAMIYQSKTIVIDLDLKQYFDNVRHDVLFKKVAIRVNDDQIMRLLKLLVKSSGKIGLPQGGVISPLLSNIYLQAVDEMLERAKEYTACKYRRARIEYCRFADDMLVLVEHYPEYEWLVPTVYRRLKEEFAKLKVEINEEKSKILDLRNQEGKCYFLGFRLIRRKMEKGSHRILTIPRPEARKKIRSELKAIFKRNRSRSVHDVIKLVNPVIRGWVNYYKIGNSSEIFSFMKSWLCKKVRRHMGKSRNLGGFGWKRWSEDMIFKDLGLFNDFRVLPRNQSDLAA